MEATDTPQAQYFRRRAHRTYEQVSEALKISTEPVQVPCNLSNLSLRGKFFLHCLRGHRPHCVALLADESDLWELRDGTQHVSVERDIFLKAWSTSIDRVYLVLFQVGGPKVEEAPMQPNVKERRRLLQLQAAARQVVLYADSDAESGEHESIAALATVSWSSCSRRWKLCWPSAHGPLRLRMVPCSCVPSVLAGVLASAIRRDFTDTCGSDMLRLSNIAQAAQNKSKW